MNYATEHQHNSDLDLVGINKGAVKADSPVSTLRPPGRGATIQPLLTADDVAAVLQVHPRTVQRWCRARQVPHVRIGRKIRFTVEQLEEIVMAYTRAQDVGGTTDIPNPAYRERPVVVQMDVAPAT